MHLVNRAGFPSLIDAEASLALQAGVRLPMEDAAPAARDEAASIERSALAQGLDPSATGQPGAWQQNDLFD